MVCICLWDMLDILQHRDTEKDVLLQEVIQRGNLILHNKTEENKDLYNTYADNVALRRCHTSCRDSARSGLQSCCLHSPDTRQLSCHTGQSCCDTHSVDMSQ